METTNVRPVTAATTAVWGETILAAGTFTVTLPAPSWGLAPVIVKNTGTGVVTVARAGTALIDGATSLLLTPKQTTTVIGDGTAWRAVAATAGVATAPTNPVAVAGVLQAFVSFTAPAQTGGSPITSYTATSTPGGITGTGSSSPVTVTGLAAGTAYTFTVRATTSVGDSAESVSSNSVTPTAAAVAPPAPTIGTAVGASGTSVTVPHTLNGTGGSPITSTTITPFIGATAQTAQTFADGLLTHVVTGLTNGTAYTFKVKVTNSIGTSPDSAASNTVTPTAPFDPAAIAGLSHWLKADSLALADGAGVATWADSSAAAKDATQATAGLRPVYHAAVAALNGKPAVRFARLSTQWLQTASPVSTVVDNYTLIFVANAATTGFLAAALYTNGTGGGGVGFYTCTAVSQNVGALVAGVAWQDATALPPSVTPKIYMLKRAAGVTTLYADGVAKTINSPNATPTAPTGATRVGGQGDTTNFFDGDLAEALTYSAAVSTADLNLIGNHLASKYGIVWTTIP